ncbi:benzoate/H(+) symporter BenE family transporter [Rhabdaerophilum sp. SD176]|uniref:benzoate/H(+) symporter BenE family transporter n=1 Tax=Rhabdaerophilum sp. SD176 TaxID=2983548 RepID=UPI0024DF768E|nr:benzoate/H(+) symporter BenE family transporter [Rhabdaerophilum sp. SD176]
MPETAPESRQGLARLLADFSIQATVQGLVISVVGYASAVAILIKGLAAMGASEAEIASGLLVVGLAKGVVAIALSLSSRMPISIAWTTPGLAFMATMGILPGGFPAAIGAFVVVGLLIVLAGFWTPLVRLVQAIPKTIANAMLAGILLKLCLAPFIAVRDMPLLGLAILATWLVLMRFARLWAVPAAVAIALGGVVLQGGGGEAFRWPGLVLVVPTFSVEALLGLALPLFVVTMASQNITGYAVLTTFGYRPSLRQGLAATGATTVATALAGAPPINYAAITAALCAGPEAHPDPARRYIATIAAGLGYILLAGLAAMAAALVLRASPVLVEAAAGLALIPAFGAALRGALEDEEARIPALLTFLATASGLTLFGIGGAFWGLLLGWAMLLAFRFRPDSR